MRKRELAIFLGTVVLALYGINASARHWLRLQGKSHFEGDPRVVVLSKDPNNAPAPRPGKRPMLLMGSSHIYALPGLERNAPLREESDKTLIYELARRISGDDILFYRVSYPNFLGLEMLSCIENLRQRGHHFDTVVLGIAWQNLARNRNLRYDIERLYGRDEFVEQMRRDLSDPAVAAAPDVFAAIDAAQRKLRKEVENEALRSDADVIETKLASQLKDKIFLLGHSEALRAHVYRLIVLRAQEFFIKGIGEESYRYDVVPSDLKFNLACTFSLLRLLAHDHCKVLIYLAPERADMTPLIDESNKDAVLGDLYAEAHRLGFAMVDAGATVPSQFWGWAEGLPDRGHFLEPGHKLLATFLFNEGEKHHVWAPLQSPLAHPN